jgi:hypothetical protein
MNRLLLILLAVLAAVGTSCGHKPEGRPQPASQTQQASKTAADRDPPDGGQRQADGREYFSYGSLNEDLVRLANEEYGNSRPDYSDPDNNIGTPPFKFVKRVDCDVLRVDETVERLIKRSPDIATYHTVVILRDARKDLYAFTLTSTVPDKSVVRLQHYGPLTDENPSVVNLPISKRRLTEFPIDFDTRKPLGSQDGRCVFIPYPFPADQEYWVFGTDPHSSPLQGLYRNDRFRNVDEVISLIVEGVKREEAGGGSIR